ncbi:MAG TPA: hypothetical protein VF006_09075 [Longimicrobium sp.]
MEIRRTLSIAQRLRPIRLAYLVRPNDRASLRTIFQHNTVIWGGSFNGIIPAVRRLRGAHRRGQDVVAGYTRVFLPDYIVAMEPDLVNLLDFPKSRILAPEHILPVDGNSEVRYGLGVLSPYSELYDKEFKFQRRHPVEIILPTIGDVRMQLFGAACFGEFPKLPAFSFFEESYRNHFDPAPLEVGPGNLYLALALDKLFPRRAALYGLDQKRSRPGRAESILFFLNAQSPADLIDFWNLRAVGEPVLPLPIKWKEALRPACEQLIEDTYSSNRGWTTLMCARSLSSEEMLAYAETLTTPAPRALNVEPWYPPIWEHGSSYSAGVTITAKRTSQQVEVLEDHLEFESISPTFPEDTSSRGGAKWVNVVNIKDYSDNPESVPVLPEQLLDWNDVVRDISIYEPWVTAEGIIIPLASSETHRWRLPTSVRLFRSWMREQGFEITVSAAGRTAREFLRKVGRYGLQVFAKKELIDLLNRMAHGQVEQTLAEENTRLRAYSRAVPASEVFRLLQKLSNNHLTRAKNELEFLTSKDILRLGLRLRCTLCEQYNWFPVDQLQLELSCERCLRKFPFPSASPPPDTAWYYRAAGPFATENYAQGAYTVAAAIFALGMRLRKDVTWMPSIELERSGFPKLETDFVMLWKERFSEFTRPRLIFGDCKTYQPFGIKALRGMQRLGAAFPESAMAFCTLREELAPSDRRRLAQMARAGRQVTRSGRTRNPVIILTARELLGKGMPGCWETTSVGSSKPESWLHQLTLGRLADLTQQLYLDLEPYEKWLLGRKNR